LSGEEYPIQQGFASTYPRYFTGLIY
jgi:hypothetical protein